MFEFIGIAVVCWVAFLIINGVVRGASTVRSQEFGKEARHIATKDLQVPGSYYNHLTINKMESIKNSAILLRDGDDGFKRCSWPRLLALVIYGEFHQDCEQWRLGNPIKEQLFLTLGISSETIAHELNRDARSVIYEST